MDSTKMAVLEAIRKDKSLYSVDAETKCIHWMGEMTSRNYPTFQYKGRRYGVRSLVYEANFRMVTGFFVKMTCKNRDCINPHHMVETRGIREEEGIYNDEIKEI